MAAPSSPADRHLPPIQPLTARSVVLSTLLGFHPPALPVSSLVRVAALFGVAERATRTALTRMVGDGDLTAVDGHYRLADRLLHRQLLQDAACSPRTKPWDGRWELAIVTAPPRPLSDRVALRRTMAELRLAELREGVWTRPANLLRDRHGVVSEQCSFFDGTFEDAATLVGTLWNLVEWSVEADRLLAALDDVVDLASGFLVSAEVIRHLLTDPCLPAELLPDGWWPGDELRRRYASYNTSFATRLRAYSDV